MPILEYFAQLESDVIGLVSYGSAHYWARRLMRFGHTVKLINPRLVKPYVKGNKNEFNDAEAIFEAVQQSSPDGSVRNPGIPNPASPHYYESTRNCGVPSTNAITFAALRSKVFIFAGGAIAP